MATFQLLAQQAAELDARYLDIGDRALDAIRQTDAELARELDETWGETAARWLTAKTPGFGGRSALALLANGERDRVMQAIHQVKHGIFS